MEKMPKDGINWLECIPFTGPEAQMPLGIIIATPGITIFDLIKDTKKTATGKVYDVVLDEDLVKEISGADGSGILIADATGHGNMTRQQFYETHGQRDGLKGWAIRKLYLKEHGGGVHVGD
jgi:hypothetical protein